MEYRTKPSNLILKDEKQKECSCCNDTLIYEIKYGKYQIGNDCSYCRYLDRPFTLGSSSLENHYPDGCICEYGKKKYKYIICENCLKPSCKKCKKKIINSYCKNDNCFDKICSDCNKKYEKNQFNNKWKNSNAEEKLDFYGKKKILILAKKYKIKGAYKMKKDELINILKNNVTDNDFPIS